MTIDVRCSLKAIANYCEKLTNCPAVERILASRMANVERSSR